MASTSGNEASSETSDKLVAKSSGVKSAVWGYFGFKPDAEGKAKVQDSAICQLCKKTVSHFELVCSPEGPSSPEAAEVI